MRFWQSYEYREGDKQVKWVGEGTLQEDGRTRAGEGAIHPDTGPLESSANLSWP